MSTDYLAKRCGPDQCNLSATDVEAILTLLRSFGACLGCIEKEKRLTEAIALIRRGVNMLNRTGWEPGETDDEWRMKANAYLVQHEMETEYLKSQGKVTER